MAARQPTSSSSSPRRTKDPVQEEMAIGSFRRLEEIGRGSFATVYKAAYSVSPHPINSTMTLIDDIRLMLCES